jgi:endonuclease YncB( thermonuclease family)
MRRQTAWIASLFALFGCRPAIDVPHPGERTARVYNAIDFGLTNSTTFAVSRVDGASVHRKFDRDRFVELTPGEHALTVRFYSESLSRALRGVSECGLTLQAEAGAEYYLEGVVDGDRWHAQLVDPRRGGAVTRCLFAAASLDGRVEGGTQRLAVSSLAAAPPQSAAAAAGEAGGPGTPPPAVAAAAMPVAVASDEPFAVAAMRGRGHSGCRAGRYRVDAVRGEVISLGGSERVRLLGVEPRSETYARSLEEIVGQCVELELDATLGERGHHDRDGNLLAYVRGEDGVLLNLAVVRRGAATVDTSLRGRYIGDLLAAQSEARIGQRGIWKSN